MMRDIVRIDADKCNGCGACAEACSEGAIKMIEGKAVLVSEEHCDGLGACLPSCPAGAITIERKDVVPFRDAAEKEDRIGLIQARCPGSSPAKSAQWPVQLRLVPETAPFFDGCDLLVAADCAAVACEAFHRDFKRGRAVLIGCPKLDPQDCWSKLDRILALNDVRSVTAVRMSVPCCSPLARHAEEAVKRSGRSIPFEAVVLDADGARR